MPKNLAISQKLGKRKLLTNKAIVIKQSGCSAERKKESGEEEEDGGCNLLNVHESQEHNDQAEKSSLTLYLGGKDAPGTNEGIENGHVVEPMAL